jgi:hypothetical protein
MIGTAVLEYQNQYQNIEKSTPMFNDFSLFYDLKNLFFFSTFFFSELHWSLYGCAIVLQVAAFYSKPFIRNFFSKTTTTNSHGSASVGKNKYVWRRVWVGERWEGREEGSEGRVWPPHEARTQSTRDP